MLFPVPSILDILGPALPFMVAALVFMVVAKIARPLISIARQRAYDTATAGGTRRLELSIGRGRIASNDRPVALIRAIHPQRMLSADGWWPRGWPRVELRTISRNGRLVWQVEGTEDALRLVRIALAAAHPGVDLHEVQRRDPMAVWSAVARLRRPSSAPLGDPSMGGAAVLSRLGALLESSAAVGGEVRYRVIMRPIDPKAWQHALYPEEASRSIWSLVWEDLLDTIFNRPHRDEAAQQTLLSPLEREAQQRKRAGRVGFEVGLVLEISDVDPASAKSRLAELAEFTTALGDGYQGIRWQFRRGAVGSPPPRFQLGDWELAQVWYLPDAAFDAANLPRERPLARPAPPVHNGPALTVGETRVGPLQLPAASLARHMAVVGSTGSGKSTLLLNLALGVLDTPMGATVIDPHGDLANDILCRIPRRHADRVHVLRLADRPHPRGFNFLERSSDQAQLVASEFVGLFQDLWPDYTGPKMQHYLRNALLTLLSHPEPQTIVELVRLLTDDAFRARYLRHVDDAMLAAFWRNEWPSPAGRERDTSIKAVLNKLGAFVSYQSIRDVVGQGRSTIRPRPIMDSGDLLVVDLSQVGPDNARLFGAMLISRYYIDAVGREGTDRDGRRQHLLIVDEVASFDTRALVKIHDEGRKFGLVLVTAAQSLKGLGERLRDSVLTNAGVIGAMSLGIDDAHHLRRLYEPLTVEDLLSLPAYEVLLRMPGPDGPAAFQGRVCLPPPGDPAVVAAIVAASDRRDARPLDQVRAEVRRREGGDDAGGGSARDSRVRDEK
jgi:Helicase HerA, central domain